MRTGMWVPAILAALAVVELSGCARTQLMTNEGRRDGRVYGDYGITGNSNQSRIEGGSLLRKLSIIGSNNQVVVDDDVSMAKIEIVGSNNDIELPYGLNPYFAQIGRNNVVRNRPAPWTTGPGRLSTETTRTTTTVEIDEDGNVSTSTTPPVRTTPPPAREPAPAPAEPTDPDKLP
ncbi:MAG: DUF3060 domain-containing protein [Planctomycetia bacterium]|nr:MAG: DUF3060 domain-containing protein [Planctomycetia bacterium]